VSVAVMSIFVTLVDSVETAKQIVQNFLLFISYLTYSHINTIS